ncbi:hypothetical protein MHK_005743 [Candidatus Magnetomorum sp. HK-1]|nr:hypothetical protein MHK_005743 [Candidatus Magnetomorum sp. HK-1]
MAVAIPFKTGSQFKWNQLCLAELFQRVAIPFKTGSQFKSGFELLIRFMEGSQSPSKPGHNSNLRVLKWERFEMSQSPSKPGHNSNCCALDDKKNLDSRNPLQNRVTIQIPGFYYVTTYGDVAIPFKTGSQFKSPLNS